MNVVIFLTLIFSVMTSHVYSQGITGRSDSVGSAPYQQRLSPYLDLMRDDNSVLDPYFSFVRPRRELRQSIGSQGSQIRKLERDVARPASSSSSRLPTGGGATFNNYLHYYQFNSHSAR